MKWNLTSCRGGRRRIWKLRRSRSQPDWMNPNLKNILLLVLTSNMNSSSPNSQIEIADRAHTIYSLTLPEYKVSVSIETSPTFTRDTTVISKNGSGYNINYSSALFWADLDTCYNSKKLVLVANTNQNISLTLPEVILRIRSGNIVYNAILLVSDYFSVKVLIGFVLWSVVFTLFALLIDK